MPNMIQIDDEIFVEITDASVRDILPNTYFINEDGKVFSTISNRFMNPSIANTGYLVLNFKTKSGKSRCQNIHRIVMITFTELPKDDRNQVNHIDGNKLNSSIDNLEWISLIGNNEHAQENGLLLTGDKCNWSKLTEKDVNEICRHLVDNDFGTLNDLAKIYNVAVTTIGDIARRISWKHISCNYDFNYNIRAKFTENDIHFICKIFEEYKNQSFNYCYYYIIFSLQLEDNKSNRERIHSIYKRESISFKYIMDQYNY